MFLAQNANKYLHNVKSCIIVCTSKRNGLNEMSIENQISDHCNTQESICPECHANMYIELCSTVLKCSECDHTIETDEDLN